MRASELFEHKLVEDEASTTEKPVVPSATIIPAHIFDMTGKDRELLITFANSMRDIDPNVWIRQVLKETKDKENCIIDDVRYQNEVDALIKDGWIFIQLHIPYELQKERMGR